MKLLCTLLGIIYCIGHAGPVSSDFHESHRPKGANIIGEKKVLEWYERNITNREGWSLDFKNGQDRVKTQQPS